MKSSWRVVYYIDSQGDNPVSKFIDDLSYSQQSKILRIFQYIQEYGLDSVISHLKKLTGTPFWEIRILGKDNVRIIYVVPNKYNILVLHGFIKKKQKTPRRDLEIAIQRYKEYQLTNDI